MSRQNKNIAQVHPTMEYMTCRELLPITTKEVATRSKTEGQGGEEDGRKKKENRNRRPWEEGFK